MPEGNKLGDQDQFLLPYGVFLDICQFLSLRDIARIRRVRWADLCQKGCVHQRIHNSQTCKTLLCAYASHARGFSGTVSYIHRDSRKQSTNSGPPLGVISWNTASVVQRRNWSSPAPNPSTQEPKSRNIFLEFLSGRGNRWLLSQLVT
jgi:hypothetical protein